MAATVNAHTVQNSHLQNTVHQREAYIRELEEKLKVAEGREGVERNNILMEAEYRDSKKLSQIIKLSRNNNRGETNMLKIGDQTYSGDAQVLSAFFKFHQNGSVPPEPTQHEDDHLYRRATVDVTSIRYILRQRGWKLPSVSWKPKFLQLSS